MTKFALALGVLSTVIFAPAISAQTVSELQVQKDKLEEQLKVLRGEEVRLRRLERICADVVTLGGSCSAGLPAPTPIPTEAQTPTPTATAQADQQHAAIVTTAAEKDTGSAEKVAAAELAAASLAAASQAAKRLKEEEATRKFGGLELGVGLSFTWDLGRRDRVTEAELVNNIVRIKNADNARARIMLESHYFFKPRTSFFGLVDEDMWGFGPFVAIQAGTDEIIEAVGGGIMIGFRRAKDEANSFNLGFGVVVDPNVTVLGDGIYRDKPLPTGETELRLKEDSQFGALWIASFTF